MADSHKVQAVLPDSLWRRVEAARLARCANMSDFLREAVRCYLDHLGRAS